MTKFTPWPKIPRLHLARLAILEKIDGTNAAVRVGPDEEVCPLRVPIEYAVVGVQSRTQLITPDMDNFGFAAWAHGQLYLAEVLGPGAHFGEWAGPGIQKNPLGLDEKYFFLFEWFKWPLERLLEAQKLVPNLRVAPVLFEGDYGHYIIKRTFDDLARTGSHVVTHSASAEGIVIHLGGTMFKMTFDDNHKGPAL